MTTNNKNTSIAEYMYDIALDAILYKQIVNDIDDKKPILTTDYAEVDESLTDDNYYKYCCC
jgi:hypothetical protein